MSEQRTKEIGVRKVLGAGTFSIVKLLNSEFLGLIGISSLFACPASYAAMTVWLQNFSYRIHIPLWIFFVSSGLALGIALLTISPSGPLYPGRLIPCGTSRRYIFL